MSLRGSRIAFWGLVAIAIGLGLTLVHLIGIPVTNLSVNPARSTGPALFVWGWAISQLWLFWIAPLIGGILGGVVYRAAFAQEVTPQLEISQLKERLKAGA